MTARLDAPDDACPSLPASLHVAATTRRRGVGGGGGEAITWKGYRVIIGSISWQLNDHLLILDAKCRFGVVACSYDERCFIGDNSDNSDN